MFKKSFTIKNKSPFSKDPVEKSPIIACIFATARRKVLLLIAFGIQFVKTAENRALSMLGDSTWSWWSWWRTSFPCVVYVAAGFYL